MILDKEKILPKFGEWRDLMEPILEHGILQDIYRELKRWSKEGKIICPDSEHTFRTFVATPPSKLKCIFVLQDPYPAITPKDKIKIANGIAMDCSNVGKNQPTLDAWYEGIGDSEGMVWRDVKDKKGNIKQAQNMNTPASLEFYYNQGVMFLNSALTVEYAKTGSHEELWRPFMAWFLEEVFNSHHFTGIPIVLCGKISWRVERYIQPLFHHIFKIEHPSAAARSSRLWEYKNVFKMINVILQGQMSKPIVWAEPKALTT